MGGSGSVGIERKKIVKKKKPHHHRRAINSSGNGGPENNDLCTYRGIIRQRRTTWGKWVSKIHGPNPSARIWLGTLDDSIEAALAYDDDAARKIYGSTTTRLKLSLPESILKPSTDRPEEKPEPAFSCWSNDVNGSGGDEEMELFPDLSMEELKGNSSEGEGNSVISQFFENLTLTSPEVDGDSAWVEPTVDAGGFRPISVADSEISNCESVEEMSWEAAITSTWSL